MYNNLLKNIIRIFTLHLLFSAGSILNASEIDVISYLGYQCNAAITVEHDAFIQLITYIRELNPYPFCCNATHGCCNFVKLAQQLSPHNPVIRTLLQSYEIAYNNHAHARLSLTNAIFKLKEDDPASIIKQLQDAIGAAEDQLFHAKKEYIEHVSYLAKRQNNPEIKNLADNIKQSNFKNSMSELIALANNHYNDDPFLETCYYKPYQEKLNALNNITLRCEKYVIETYCHINN